jgi:hypothetical protein
MFICKVQMILTSAPLGLITVLINGTVTKFELYLQM